MQLLPDLRLMRLSSDEVRQYHDACEPRHLNFTSPVGGGQRYAFVRQPRRRPPRVFTTSTRTAGFMRRWRFRGGSRFARLALTVPLAIV